MPTDSRSLQAVHPLVVRVGNEKFSPAESFRAWETLVPKMERTFLSNYLPPETAAFFGLRSLALA